MKNSLLLFIIVSCLIPCHTYALRVAKITQFIGDVKTERNNMVMGVRINLFISEGDWLETGKESEVYLLFKNGSKLRIGENSKFTVNSCLENQDGSRDIKSFVKLGSVICNIKKMAGQKGSFELSTPTATCSIRGTVFETVVLNDGSSRFNVLEGIIDVGLIGSDKFVQVHPNKQVKLDKNTKTITPTDIPVEEKAKLIKKAKKVILQEKETSTALKDTKKKEESTEESDESEEEEEEEEETEEEEEQTEEETSEEGEESEDETAEEEGESQEEMTQEEILSDDIIDEIIQEDSEPIKNEIPIEEILESVPSPSSPEK